MYVSIFVLITPLWSWQHSSPMTHEALMFVVAVKSGLECWQQPADGGLGEVGGILWAIPVHVV